MIENKRENDVVSRIAKKIRTTRLEKKLTIQQLATRTNVSKGLLSKIENSRTIPSLPVFVTLIESLDISLREFFDDLGPFSGKGYLLIKKNQQLPLSDPGVTGVSIIPILKQRIPGRIMDVALFTLAGGRKGSRMVFDGYAFNYILKGACEYQIHDEVVLLEDGDAIYYDGSNSPWIANKSKGKTILLSIHFGLLK